MNTILDFVALLDKEQNERVDAQYPVFLKSAISDGADRYYIIGIDSGPKYTRVWIKDYKGNGKSVKYFVENETGKIFGASGWKAPNFKRQFGTLQTINDWDWHEYSGWSKTGESTLTLKSERKR